MMPLAASPAPWPIELLSFWFGCRYGNTSSSTVWYSFGFVESVQGVKRGDVVWQVRGAGAVKRLGLALWHAGCSLG